MAAASLLRNGAAWMMLASTGSWTSGGIMAGGALLTQLTPTHYSLVTPATATVGVALTVDLRLRGGTVSTVDTGVGEWLSTGRRG